ncbi:MAG: archaeosortase/exosortase family protein, partial [Verrucomicrobia bacterium]|nr:archaeosortase/exosortase family protein [Verrucomicrobiota bacterium]
MTKPDYGMLAVLVVLGGFIWLQDLGWLDAAGDTLPILTGLPLFAWLNRPWRLRSGGGWCEPRAALLAGILFPAGALLGSTLVLGASWTALLWSWLSARTEPRPQAAKLLVLPLLSFPWLATDFERIGWWFRLSGAAATERVLTWCQFDVSRQGTLLSVAGFTVSVEPACSGVNGLQAMLIAGTVLAYLKLRTSRLFWGSLPLLILAAWAANVVRITVSALTGIGLNAEAAVQQVQRWHWATGWLAL